MKLYDKLTGLYSYEYFLTEVEKALSLKKYDNYILIRFDIKNFKLVNDTFGMELGDRLLCRVAEALQSQDLPDMICCRLDGDRFGVFIPDEYEAVVLELLLKTSFYADEDTNYQVFLYMGLYQITDTSIPVTTMSDRANIALATIKSNRFVRVATYEESMYKEIVQECEFSTELEGAMEHGDIKIYLQPQVTVDGSLAGAEALVRWEHPVKGLLNPGSFIPVFEKNYKIVDIDMYVWELACKTIKKWNDEGREGVYISVNISPRDFETIDVYATLIRLVEKYQIDPGQLRVEITETTIMKNPEKQIELIGRLRLAKFYVEMDDFGSGYSSLGMLKDIHLDAIKLDMRFLAKGSNEHRGRTVLELTVRLIKELHMTAIAEGVETLEEVEQLKEIGCDVFQGFYFSRPIPVEKFEEEYMSN